MPFDRNASDEAAYIDPGRTSGPPIGRKTLTQRNVARVDEVQRAADHARLDVAWGGPVQLAEDAHSGLDDAAIQNAAAHGISEPGGALPYLDTIQRSFGGHDVSGINAHVGGAAREGSEAMGAHAYATGNDVAFARSPDLFLVAHEAAHVVQQRAGVSLKGAVGQVGDAYEQNADAVAARVVAGESAEDLLGPVTGAIAGGGVQRKAEPKPDPAMVQWELDSAMRVLDDVLDHETSRIIDDMPSKYRAAIEKLYEALAGQRVGKKDKIAGRERRELFDAAILAMAPLLEKAKPIYRTRLASRRETMLRLEADDRIDNSFIVDKKIVEMPDDRHPHEQASILRTHLPKLVQSMSLVNEQLLRLGHHDLEHVIHELQKGGHGNYASKLAMMHGILAMADGWLLLTDDELKHHLNDIHGFLPGVATFSELVKAIVEITVGGVSLTAAMAAGILKLAGEGALAASAMGVAAQAGHVLGNAVAGIEIVHGIVVLLDPKATNKQKEDAAVGVLSGGAWFVGKRIGGAAVGGPASVAIILTYLELKIAAYLYWQGALGINTLLMKEAFKFMQENGATIARQSEAMSRAGLLHHEEQDPIKAAPLAKAEEEHAQILATTIDWFLQHSLSSGKDMGFGSSNPAAWPGNYPILVEAFAPLQGLRGVKSGQPLAAAASAMLEKITWCLAHAADIAVASTKGKDLKSVEEADEKAKKKKEHGEE